MDQSTSLRALLPLALLLFSLLPAARANGDLGDGERVTPSPPADSASPSVRFNRDVRPLLADRCFACHGPDAQQRKGRLRLDSAEGSQGAYRSRRGKPAIQPGSIEESELWQRVTSDFADDRMPPEDAHVEALQAEELDLLRRWIDEGAEYEEHWAFVAPVRPDAPEVEQEDWCQQPLDRFVLHGLEARGLRPSPRADRRTLIRRVSFDLCGLPPTRDEIQAFLSDDTPGAYERLVERLLARPQYGEHMTKYWLDLVRFADTNGVHHDHYREMAPYRDWVIRSFNDSLPYDEFVAHQVAGDVYPDPTNEQLTASGFNRLHLIIDRGTMLPEESLARNVIDRTTAFSTAFLGLTAQCAVCHDHKFDPITQKDFYQLSAFFNNFDGDAETGAREGTDFLRGLQPPYIEFPSEEQSTRLAELDRELEPQRSRIESLESDLAAAAGAMPLEQDLRARLEQSRNELQKLQQERDAIQITVPAAMVMKERDELRPAHIFVRGAYDNPGERVERGTPTFLPPMKAKDGTRSRLDLAEWLVAREHPLTARVAVNRFWQQLFGVGLVKTAEDFGTQGEWPRHLELLDHLTVSFVETGWDVKALLKQILLSATYQQSSQAAPSTFEADPENRWLARGSRFRMDSEMIRDQILATSGLLSATMYGASVKPPQPPGLWSAVSLPDSYPRTYVADEGDKAYRRSLYTFRKRGMPPPQMSMLNAPTRESCTARRERTNTPLQALLLLNEREYLGAARHLAAATLAGEPLAAAQRLERIYETITSRLPSAAVSRTLLQSVADLEALYAEDPELARDLCAGLTLRDGQSATQLAAWTLLTSTIYNLDITKTRE